MTQFWISSTMPRIDFSRSNSGPSTDQIRDHAQPGTQENAASIASAVEQRLYVGQLDMAALALLQVSLNILKNPAQAVRDLLDV